MAKLWNEIKNFNICVVISLSQRSMVKSVSIAFFVTNTASIFTKWHHNVRQSVRWHRKTGKPAVPANFYPKRFATYRWKWLDMIENLADLLLKNNCGNCVTERNGMLLPVFRCWRLVFRNGWKVSFLATFYWKSDT